ncbi:NAD-dependent epimerase/dehydratase family protein, partial [Loktanella salsilacus]|uniref:NAD-dependent epimerase/dehydratase family protein n=1 Tax=Loktanella salsilacus TaxID=195913 RepID=UPI00356842A5
MINTAPEKQRVTVVGGSGFIGTNLCRILDSAGVDFEIIDLKQSRSFPGKTKIADIRDIETLQNTISGQILINLAAVHRDDIWDRSEYYTTNVDGTRNLTKIANERGISRIIFTSTVAVYGFAPANTNELGAINPFNDYGKSKYEAEKVLRDWHAADPEARHLLVVRPTVVFGEGNRGNVYNLIHQITSGKFVMIGDGKNKKSMAYVGNVARFLFHLINNENGSQIYNYVDQPDLDMNTLVGKIRSTFFGKAIIGFRLPYLLGITVGYVFDGIARFTRRQL